MRLAGLLLAAVVCLTAVAPVLADSPDDYQNAVGEALALVQRSLEEGDPAPEVAAAGAIRALERVREVELGEGRRVFVDTGWVLAALRKNPPNLRLTELRLQSLLDELKSHGSPRLEPGSARAALQREVDRLSRSPGQRMPWDDLLDPLRRLGQDVLEWLGGLFGPRPDRGNVGDRPSFPWWGIGIVAAILAGAALILRALRQAVVPGKEGSQTPGESTERPASREYLARSQSYAAAGQLREAVRALYLATVLHLDEHGQVPFDPALTNREYLGLAAKQGWLFEALRPLVVAFDSTWYGRRALTLPEFEQYRQLVRKIGLAA